MKGAWRDIKLKMPFQPSEYTPIISELLPNKLISQFFFFFFLWRKETCLTVILVFGIAMGLVAQPVSSIH